MYHGRIYIAENDREVQRALKALLMKSGYEVTIFETGYPIVTMMDDWPDLFLIEIELPGINGLEVCKWLKSHDSSHNIPVIFLSGDPYLKILSASAHADDYIEKPLSYLRVIHKIRECLLAEKRGIGQGIPIQMQRNSC
ncbi:MAG: response regulator [Cyclobacteriaceae bacterium]